MSPVAWWGFEERSGSDVGEHRHPAADRPLVIVTDRVAHEATHLTLTVHSCLGGRTRAGPVHAP